MVDPPFGPDHPPLLRMERGGVLVTVPLDLRAVEQLVRTGQEGPLLAEIKQAFLRMLKASERKQRSAPPRKSIF